MIVLWCVDGVICDIDIKNNVIYIIFLDGCLYIFNVMKYVWNYFY